MQLHSNKLPNDGQAPSVEKIDKNVYLRHVHRAMDNGNYFFCFRQFYRIMKKLDVLFIQDIINIGGMPKTKRDPSNWFLCTGEYLEVFGWTAKEQDARFKSLIQLGYIKTERRGIPTLRWVWIDLYKLHSDIDDAEENGHSFAKNKPKSPIPDGESHLPPNGGKHKPTNGGGIKECITYIPENINKGVPAQRNAAAGVPQQSNSHTKHTKIPRQPRSGIHAATQDTIVVSAAARPTHKPSPSAAASDSSLPRSGGQPNPNKLPRQKKVPTPQLQTAKQITVHIKKCPSVDGQETAMPFVTNQQLPTSTRDKPQKAQQRCNTVDADRAAKLRSHAKQQGYTVSKSPKRWADAFRILREQGIVKIDEVLDWFIRTNPTKPKIHDAYEFRMCFNWLLEIMGHNIQNVDVVVTKEAEEIVQRVQADGWPTNCGADDLGKAIQVSLNNLRQFLVDCRTVQSQSKVKDRQLANFAEHVVRGDFVDARFTVTSWFVDLAAWMRKQKIFRGSIMKLVLSLDNEHFHKLGAAYAAEWTGGDSSLWTRLVCEVRRLTNG